MATISSHLRSIVNQDGAVILDVPHDRMVTLNPTGAYLWDKLCQGKNVQEAARDLAADTRTHPSVVERDVQIFVEQLRSSQLIED